jgi:hypothetical protein
LRGFEPLCIDARKLVELHQISPILPYEVLAEFAALSRALSTSAADLPERSWWLEHPLDTLLTTAAANLNIVNSPPKVGGSTLGATLAQRGPVHGSHFLGANGLAFMERRGWHSARIEATWVRLLLRVNRALRHSTAPGKRVRKPFVFAAVREAASLHLSLICDSWATYTDHPRNLTEDLVHQALATDPWTLINHDWFTDEFREILGVDVYSRPFPTKQGWDLYENDIARVLVIRQENMSALPHALSVVFGEDPAAFKVINANLAAEKCYAPYYDAIKNSLHFTAEELQTLYSLPYMKHFYAPEEIERFEKRWQSPRMSDTLVRGAA